MFDFQFMGVSIVGLIMAVVDRLKAMGFPSKYAPFVAIGLGMLAGVFIVDPGKLDKGLIDGLFLGLSAVGTHSGLKNVIEGIQDTIAKAKAAKAQAQQTQQQQ